MILLRRHYAFLVSLPTFLPQLTIYELPLLLFLLRRSDPAELACCFKSNGVLI